MKSIFSGLSRDSRLPAVLAAIIILILLTAGGYEYYFLSTELKETRSTLASTTGALKLATEEGLILTSALYSEQQKNKQFEEQISAIASTVGTLEKLKRTDPELLQKYSKVYFLNEHYLPEKLTLINPSYLVNKNREEYIQAQVWSYLERMLSEAAEKEVPLLIISAYRSFTTQSDLKSNYVVTYGSGANKFSADQGYSEHQLGTTVDFSTPTLGTAYTKIAGTKAYAWLQENAHRFGFVLSYPEKNNYYQFEPWHWRFVGVALATKLHQSNQHFYDLEQREINTYLVNFFD